MKLVICEKNIAASRIASILSKGSVKRSNVGSVPVYEFDYNDERWRIIGLRGHIIKVDYPVNYNAWKKIDPKDLISVEPEKKITESRIASALKTLVSKNPFIIVATDYDREGELIGVEVLNLLRTYTSDFSGIKRARFSAFTGYEIHDAFSKLTEVDYDLSSAGESRQIIDLIWGAVLTRFISLTSNKVGRDFLSIGRVQSPTLALLVEREKEITSFVPKPYWKIFAHLKKNISFEAVHQQGQFWEKDEVEKIFNHIKDEKEANVLEVKKETKKELPPAPFSTTTFLQAASQQSISAAQAMKLAEELYMSGLISYPRTDNTVYPRSLNIKNILEKLKHSSFSKEVDEVLTNGRSYPTRGKKQTTDHPPIHPVGAPKSELSGAKKKVYELIVRRFLATLAKDAVAETIDATFDIKNEIFEAHGYKLVEPNWKAIYPYFNKKDIKLPDMKPSEMVTLTKITVKEDTTKPPSRYSQGSLIATMEQLSLGTKSTRHEIIQKLYQRKYISLSPLAPTPLAIAVIDAMGDCQVVKPKMTARLEADMDLIAEGKKTLEETVKESRELLKKAVTELEKRKEQINSTINEAHREQNYIGKCPKCGKDLVIKISRNRKRFVACSGFPECKNTYPLPQKGLIIKTDKICKTCQTPVLRIKSKGKRPWEMCLDPNCSTQS
jgi:DNA topoisomerase I